MASTTPTLDRLPRPYQAAGKTILFPMYYGVPVARVSIDVIERQSSWKAADPEDRLRHLGMWIWIWDWHGVTYGFGQMARDWKRAWEQHQAMPWQFSSPEGSYHVEDKEPKLLLPTACDNVGTGSGGSPPDQWRLIHQHCHLFGLRTVSAPNEKHHTQFAEFPGSKRTYNASPGSYRIKAFTNFPALRAKWGTSRPTTPPPTNVEWDPETHNYWLFPLNQNKPVLRQGDKDADPIGHVLYMQHALLVAAYLQVKSGQPTFARVSEILGTPDGVFGPRTHLAVTLFQQLRGLEADGLVGAKTWADLDAHITLARAGA